jgi:hypothetical protein
MGLNLDKIKGRLTTLTNKSGISQHLWKPKPGKQVLRIVPYKFVPDFPFIELKFYYNMNKKTYLSPSTFGRPDPILELAESLKSNGSKEEWTLGRSLEPKMRTYAPVIVRGEEDAGIRFWGFGKQVYEELLGYIAEPDYGDITDPDTGRDIILEFKTAKEVGKSYPETSIRIRPTASPIAEKGDPDGIMESMKNQIDILDLYDEPAYDELKEIMEAWLKPDGTKREDVESTGTTYGRDVAESNSEESVTVDAITPTLEPVNESASPAATTKSAEVEKEFEKLFG